MASYPQISRYALCIIIIFHIKAVYANFTTYPQNVAGVNTFALTCGSSTSAQVIWRYNNTAISNGGSVTPGYGDVYQVTAPASGIYQLSCIASNCSGYTGAYQCTDGSGVAGAQVVVLDSVPKCSSSGYSFNTGAQITMECGVYYTGPWAPVMTWNFLPAMDVTYSISNVSTSNYVSSTLSFVASASMDGMIVSSTTFFNQPQAGDVQPTYATNVIAYKHTWSAQGLMIINPNNGLSPGAIAGIVIGSIIAIVLLILLIGCIVYKKKKAKEGVAEEKPQSDETNGYDDLEFMPKVILPQSSKPINMDMTTMLPQADRGEEYIIGPPTNEKGVSNISYHNGPDNMPDVIENAQLQTVRADWTPDFSSSRSTCGPVPMYPFMGEEEGGNYNRYSGLEWSRPDISHVIDTDTTGRFTPSSTTYSEYQTTVAPGSLDTLV